mmetsp:Transcript_33780/g.60777  ORF Transcript_33780/g.60777 Transcript_33780/m.60777 type:complete len:115 (+) Transcript_33780:81-425(+)
MSTSINTFTPVVKSQMYSNLSQNINYPRMYFFHGRNLAQRAKRIGRPLLLQKYLCDSGMSAMPFHPKLSYRPCNLQLTSHISECLQENNIYSNAWHNVSSKTDASSSSTTHFSA